jgi:hypothetical protein
MKGFSPTTTLVVIAAFVAGFFSHLLYERWAHLPNEGQGHPVTFSPLPPTNQRDADVPLFAAADVKKIRSHAGSRAKIRGRIYGVGHSTKSNTYFLNFGPSRASFTGVIFSSALERFAQKKIDPTNYKGKNVEFTGQIKNHPRFGLEMILEDPSQIKLLD